VGFAARLLLVLVAAACGRIGYDGLGPSIGQDGPGGPGDASGGADGAAADDAAPLAGDTIMACVDSCACPPEANCHFVCEGGPCALICGRGSTCTLDCAGSCGGCGLSCFMAASCTLLCAAEPCTVTMAGNDMITCDPACTCVF